jgi:hypothetical protein
VSIVHARAASLLQRKFELEPISAIAQPSRAGDDHVLVETAELPPWSPRHHQDRVLRWCQSRSSNGILEAINSLVQAAKAKARRYRTSRNLSDRAYRLAAKFNFRFHPLETAKSPPL